MYDYLDFFITYQKNLNGISLCNETHNFHYLYLLNLLDSDNEIKPEDDKKGKLFLGVSKITLVVEIIPCM